MRQLLAKLFHKPKPVVSAYGTALEQLITGTTLEHLVDNIIQEIKFQSLISGAKEQLIVPFKTPLDVEPSDVVVAFTARQDECGYRIVPRIERHYDITIFWFAKIGAKE